MIQFIRIFILISWVSLFISCKSKEVQVKENLADFISLQLGNSNSVEILNYKVFNKVFDKKLGYDTYRESNDKILLKNTEYLEVLFSANNSQNEKIFRSIYVYLDSTNNKFNKTYPENIGVEFGKISGIGKFYIGQLITNQQTQKYFDNVEILFVNVDTINFGKKYLGKIENGSFQINRMIPGNYFVKIIDKHTIMANLYENYSQHKNYNLLTEISRIMFFFKNYSSRSVNYNYTNKNLFDLTYASLENLNQGNYYNDAYVEKVWKDFKNSVDIKFIEDMDIEFDYLYLTEFDEVEINSNVPTTKDYDIKKFFF